MVELHEKVAELQEKGGAESYEKNLDVHHGKTLGDLCKEIYFKTQEKKYRAKIEFHLEDPLT